MTFIEKLNDAVFDLIVDESSIQDFIDDAENVRELKFVVTTHLKLTFGGSTQTLTIVDNLTCFFLMHLPDLIDWDKLFERLSER